MSALSAVPNPANNNLINQLAANPVTPPQPGVGVNGPSQAPAPADNSQSSAAISGLGQLFSSLQQLQNQDPAQFSQVASQVSSSLLSASQQQSGIASSFLLSLAQLFHQAATSGIVPSAQQALPTQTYDSNGQPVATTAVIGTTSTSEATLQQLFSNIAGQVGTNLGG